METRNKGRSVVWIRVRDVQRPRVVSLVLHRVDACPTAVHLPILHESCRIESLIVDEWSAVPSALVSALVYSFSGSSRTLVRFVRRHSAKHGRMSLTALSGTSGHGIVERLFRVCCSGRRYEADLAQDTCGTHHAFV